jgi:RimJ/RimL family protein N-acetyltransferase
VPDVRVEPWEPGNLELLHGLLGDPAMMAHLGGPETREKIASRQADYERPGSRQYRIVLDGEGVGWVGYWEREWRDRQVLEIGWSVLPSCQGRGLAGLATAAVLDLAAVDEPGRDVHAFPSFDNAPSNAICRKVGFELLGDVEFEYPKGSWLRCNDWRYRLPA